MRPQHEWIEENIFLSPSSNWRFLYHVAYGICLFFLYLSGRLRPEAEISAQVEGSLAAEVNLIVLDSLELLVQVSAVPSWSFSF